MFQLNAIHAYKKRNIYDPLLICNNIVDMVNSYIRDNKQEVPILEISKIIEQQSTDDAESKQTLANNNFPTFEQSQMMQQRNIAGANRQHNSLSMNSAVSGVSVAGNVPI